MATVALGAGVAFGQGVPTLQQGLRLQPNGMSYSAPPAAAFPMSFPPASGTGYPAQFPTAPQPMPTFPDQITRPTQPSSPSPAPAEAVTPDQPGPAFPVPGQPLMADPAGHGKDDWSNGFDGDNRYGPGPVPYHVWGSAEYLLWWVKPDVGTPPLATTGPAGSPAILGQLNTGVLIGGRELDFEDRSGIRGTVGFWFNKEGNVGAELTGFILEERTIRQAVASDANGFPVIARPVINAQTGMEASNLMASPGQLAGGVNFTASSEVYGAEVNFLGCMYRSKNFIADMILGFRYLGLDENLSVTGNTTVLPGGIAAFNGSVVAPGGTLTILDHFDTRNDFYGGQVGGRAQVRWNRLFADFSGKLAVGNAHEVVNINGGTTLTGTGGPSFLPGGLLAVSSNSGISSRDEFTFLPEGAIKVGVHVTDYITLFAGYTFVYWFDVARPSEQIDRTVNPALVPSNLSFGSGTGPNRPAAPFARTDFWAQGVSIGLEVRY